MKTASAIAETQRLLGAAARLSRTGEHGQALALYRTIAIRHAGASAGWRQLAAAALRAGSIAAAFVALKRALVLGPADPGTVALLPFVETGIDAGDRLRCAAMLALTNPDDATAMARLASLNQARGRIAAAEQTARRALAANPMLAEVRMNLAVILRNAARTDESRRELRRAAVLQPGTVVVWRRIAIAEELLSRLPDADVAARRALALDPADSDAIVTLAIVQRRTGHAEAALRALAELPGELRGEIKRDIVEFELGTLFDLKGDADTAFSHFKKGNAQALARMRPEQAGGPGYLGEVRAHAAVVSAPNVARWKPARPVARPPVFMVGFPRSGTTLLDQVLDAHPQVRVIEEQPLLSTIAGRVSRPVGTLPAQRIAELTDDRIAALRAEYEDLLRRNAGPDAPPVLIDKMPLNITLAGLILRLYPNARIIVSLRHPCDVCLSCFMQPFAPTGPVAQLTDLDSTSRLYTLVMGVWLRARETLSPDHIEVRYEQLVANVEDVARRTVGFLGLDWDDRVLRHLEHARSRGLIRTPSFRQVTQPIYTRASGRWQRYRKHLAPYLPRLQPFIAEFGYSVDD